MTPLELHKLEFPRGACFRPLLVFSINTHCSTVFKEPRIHYPVPPSQWDDEEEIATRPRRFSSPQLWLDLVETFKRDHLSLPVEKKPKTSRPPIKKHTVSSAPSAFSWVEVETLTHTEGNVEAEVVLGTQSRHHRHHRRSSSLRDTIVKRITQIM